jgi:hypothetical protein
LRELVAVRIDPYTGDMGQAGAQAGGTVEYLKRDAVGGIADTRYKIVSRGDNYHMYRGGDGYEEDGSPVQRWPYDSRYGSRDLYPPQSGYNPGYYYGQRVQPRSQEFPEEYRPGAPRRVDPDYFFGLFGRRPF